MASRPCRARAGRKLLGWIACIARHEAAVLDLEVNANGKKFKTAQLQYLQAALLLTWHLATHLCHVLEKDKPVAKGPDCGA